MLAEWRIVPGSQRPGTAACAAEVHLRGDVDISKRSELADCLAEVAGSRLDCLVFDLADVGYLDCSAVAALLDVAAAALPAGVKPIIVDPAPLVRRLLAISGLDGECDLEVSCRGTAGRRPDVAE